MVRLLKFDDYPIKVVVLLQKFEHASSSIIQVFFLVEKIRFLVFAMIKNKVIIFKIR